MRSHSMNEKRKKCKRLVERVFNGFVKGVISNQVLAELFFVLTKKKGIEKERLK